MTLIVTVPQAWEAVHRCGGYGAVIVAVAAVYTGMKQINPPTPPALVSAYVAWAATLAAVFVVLELVNRWRARRVNKQRRADAVAAALAPSLTIGLDSAVGGPDSSDKIDLSVYTMSTSPALAAGSQDAVSGTRAVVVVDTVSSGRSRGPGLLGGTGSGSSGAPDSPSRARLAPDSASGRDVHDGSRLPLLPAGGAIRVAASNSFASV